MVLPLAAIAILAGSIPPLTSEQEAVLASAADGADVDHREPAFTALLENGARWEKALGDAPVRLAPDFDAMTEQPEMYRGDLCRIRGRLEKIEPLHAPFVDFHGWFVRVVDDRPVLVFIDFRRADEIVIERFRPGVRVEVIARFYKRVDRSLDGPGQDGRIHSYAAFVGALPRVNARAGIEARAGGVFMIVPVGVLGVIFLLVWMYTRSHRRSPRQRMRRISDSPPDDALGARDADLPDDPGDALAVLDQRAAKGSDR